MTMVSQFLYCAANEDSWWFVFTCSGASGLAFEEKKRHNVFFDAVKDSMLHSVAFKNSG
jgi:hypothetical protein